MIEQAHKEALEQILVDLEWRANDDASLQVCLVCWAVKSDGLCECKEPTYWPINHAKERLKVALNDTTWT